MAPVAELWSSDTLRAVQTSRVFGEAFGLEGRCSPLLREVDPGVLAGLTHTEAAARHADAYAVWMLRGDLDDIESAETGTALQARGLAFLASLPPQSSAHVRVVVSHAGFIRSFINTVNGQARHSPIAVGHEDMHVVRHPWRHLPMQRTSPSWRLPACRVRTRDGSYHLKQFIPRGKGPNSGYLEVVAGIYRATLGRACVPCFAPHPTLSDIVVGVRPWIEGEHCLGRLGAVRLRQLMRMLDELHTALREISDAAAMHALQSAIVGLSRDIGCLDEREREAFRATMEKVQSMFRDNARQVVVDMDVHRENIVFTKDRAYKVDYESLSVGPAELQFASTLVGAFLLEDDTEAMAEAVAYLRRPQALNCGVVRDFMMLRALKGLAFFRCQPGKETASAARHIARYERCVDRLRYEVVPEKLDRRLKGSIGSTPSLSSPAHPLGVASQFPDH